MPDSIVVIDSNAFAECTKLEYIDFGAGTSEWFYGFLAGCINLKTIISNGQYDHETGSLNGLGLSTSYSDYDVRNEFYERYGNSLNVDTIIFRNGLTTLLSFSNDGINAKKIVIPNTVEKLDVASIASQRLTEIEIPSSVRIISPGTFSFTDNLKKIKIYSKNVTVTNGYDNEDDLFGEGVDVSNITIECYKGTNVETYAKSKGYIVEYIDEEENVTYKLLSNTENQTIGYNTEIYNIRIDADYNKFLSSGVVYVDSKLVNPKYYTTKSGSTIINFTNEFLRTLNVGNHIIKVTYANGSAETNFTLNERVNEQPVYEYETDIDPNKVIEENPKTADNGFIYLYLIGIFLIILVLCKKKLKKLAN